MFPLAAWVPVCTALLIYVVRIVELRTRRNIIPGEIRERLTLRLFVLSGTVFLLAAIIEFLVVERTYSWLLYFVGAGLGAASFWLRRRAIAALGAWWSLHIEIRERHKLIQTGPYRAMRHPTYLSMLFELLSGAFVLHAPYSLAGVGVVFIPALWLRVRLEERAMIEKFGQAYIDYRKTTPLLFPWKII